MWSSVSPYKSAGDAWSRTDFSAESRAQAEWLLDARFDELLRGIAVGRGLSLEQVRACIDRAPLGAREAQQAGLIDAVAYEDEIERRIYPVGATNLARPRRSLFRKASPAREAAPSSIIQWRDAERTLRIPSRVRHSRGIGVIAVEGMIVRGGGLRSPLPLPLFGSTSTAGSAAVAQALRRAERDDSIAAVVLFVDSQGGDALASDLIAREVRRLRTKKPVIAYMSGIAASGGYYVAALAQQIIAQPLTITGSIGVISLKPNVRDALERLGLHRESLARGANALMFSDAALDARTRGALESSLGRVYGEFKAIVAEGRKRPDDAALEEICSGRVWTGAQAQAHGLVDLLGGFDLAVQTAIECAGLTGTKLRVGWRRIESERQPLLPLAFDPLALFDPGRALHALLRRSQIWLIAPWGAQSRE